MAQQLYEEVVTDKKTEIATPVVDEVHCGLAQGRDDVIGLEF
jgi:hypothetical protein